MPYQSTKNRYKSRRERQKEGGRKIRLILLFGLILFVLYVLFNWRDYWAYWETYFMD